MQRLLVAVAISSLAMTGCPSEFGKDGRVNKAVHKDMMEFGIQRCSNERLAEVCGPGKETSDDCRRCTQSGGP